MFYLTSAESLSRGQGLRWIGGGGELRPLTHYPPLYPMLLAALALLGIDVLTAAKWASACLLGLNVIAGGWVTARMADSRWAGFCAGALLLVSPVVLDVHLEAMTEPLFLLLLIVTLAALAEHGTSGDRKPMLAASVACALAYLTRYVGLSLIACGVCVVLVWPARSVRRRLVDAVAFGAVPLAAAAVWSARNFALTGSFSNRVFNVHPITRTALRQAADTVSGWLLPVTVDLRLRVAVVLLAAILGAAALWAWRRSAEAASAPLAWSFIRVVFVFVVLYVAGLVFSLMFFDASTRLTDRILSPVHATLLLAGLVALARLPQRWRTMAALLAVCLGVSYLWRSWTLVAEARATGRGFNTASWRASETLAWVSQLPAGTIVYSNEAFPIQFFTGIPAYWVPERIDSVKGMLRPDYGDQMREMRRRLREPGSVLVVFTGSHYRVELPPLEELTQGLVRIGETRDGLLLVDPVNEHLFRRAE